MHAHRLTNVNRPTSAAVGLTAAACQCSMALCTFRDA